MKKSTKIALSLVASTMLFTGCGGGTTTEPQSDNSSGTGSKYNTPVKVEKNAKAQLGVLSKAMVKIYELGTSPHKLLFTEITTEGDTVEAIGNFNAHEKELKNDKFYLYEVHGGNDMDADDDGVVDNSPTINEGIFRAVVKGSDVKSLGGKFKVTAVSEIQYKKVEEHIDNIAVLREKLKDAPKLIIKDDLNNDGKIDGKDILLYNPVKHEHKLEKVYKDKLERIVKDIHKKDTEIDIAITPKIEGNTFILAENATSGNKVGQLEILDNGQAPITEFKLKGEGNERFMIDAKGVIRVAGLSVLSLEVLKVYNLKVVAVNRAGESDEVDLRINIMEIDNDAPAFISANKVSITENTSLIHTIEVTDASTVTFELEGDDAKFFNLAGKKLTFNQTLNFENPKDENGDNVYEVVIKATDSAENSSSQAIAITLTDVSDIVPVLKDTSFEVIENLPDGNIVGTVEVEKIGDSPISSYTLSGDGSEDFTISNDGVISVVEGVILKLKYEDVLEFSGYEKKHVPSYNLKVTATNIAGISEVSNIDIKVFEGTYITYNGDNNISFNENEIPPDIKLSAISTLNSPLHYSIKDSYFSGGGIGGGRRIIHYRQQSGYAFIERGYLKFSNMLPGGGIKHIVPEGIMNYERIIHISDDYNHSIDVPISLLIKNIVDVPPTIILDRFTPKSPIDSISRNQSDYIATFRADPGDSPITEYTLFGAGAEYFDIDFSGNISIKKTLPKNAYTFDLKAKAKNMAGESNVVSIVLKIADTDPNVVGRALMSAKSLSSDNTPHVAILSNAQVSLYEVTSEGLIKVEDFNETTSGGDYLQAGHFNSHSEDLFYLKKYMYKITGGTFLYFDKYGNPIEDLQLEKIKLVRKNTGTLSTVIEGKVFRSLKDGYFNISYSGGPWIGRYSDAYASDMLIDRNSTLADRDRRGSRILTSNGKLMFGPDSIIDLSHPLIPHRIYPTIEVKGRYDVPSALAAWDSRGVLTLSNDDTKLYVVYRGLKIYDIKNPYYIQEIPRVNKYDLLHTLDHISEFLISKDEKKLIAIENIRYQGSSIRVIDISNFENVKLIEEKEFDSAINKVILSPDELLMYVANSTDGLVIIDDNGDKFSFDLTDAKDVALSEDGTIAYVAADNEGLKIINVSNLNAMKLLGTFDTDSAISVTLSPDKLTAYVSTGYSGLKIIDISNPQSPKLKGTYKKEGYIQSVAISPDEKYAYLNIKNKIDYDSDGNYLYGNREDRGVAFKVIEISKYLNTTE